MEKKDVKSKRVKIPKTRLQGVYESLQGKKRVLYTKSLTPKKHFFNEDTVTLDSAEYRRWEPSRSKLAAGIIKGLSQIGIKPRSVVLYLGCSHGYTPSFVSDIVSNEGFVFGIDSAPRVMRDFVMLCEERKNMAAILADANQPNSYIHRVSSVDVVYQDIAQRNQAEIFIKNCDMFLEKGGFGVFCVKARSIDVTKKPKQIFKDVRDDLEKELIVVDYRQLDPFEKDHCIFVCKKK